MQKNNEVAKAQKTGAVAETKTAKTAVGVGNTESQPKVAVAETGTAKTAAVVGNTQSQQVVASVGNTQKQPEIAGGGSVENQQVVVKVGNNESQQVVKQALSIEELQQQLENQLKRISYKNEIAKNREKFLGTKRDLTQVKTFMQRENMFESNVVKIIFKTPIAGQERETFSIANTDLILKFIDVLSEEIDVKVKEIETKLISE